MKVVIDTNILVSAALKGRKPSIVIQYLVDYSECEWIVSSEILAEYKEVLSRKKLNLTEDIKRRWFELLDTSTTVIEVKISVNFPRDQKDAKFLACAIAANADFLITGDQDFQETQLLLNTTIISLSAFQELMINPL